MVDVDTFLTALYVIVDDFCQSQPAEERGPAPIPPFPKVRSLPWPSSPAGPDSASERDFYRYARAICEDAFPTLPDRSQFNRARRASILRPSKRWLCIWEVVETREMSLPSSGQLGDACPGCQAPGRMDGWPDRLTSAGPTAWDGTRASLCSPRSILPG